MSALRLLAELLARINVPIGRVGLFAGSVLVAGMTLVVIAGVFFRYVLNNSLTFVEDVALIMMVTTAFLIAPLAYRTGGNVAIEMLVEALPRIGTRLIRIVINLLVLWLVYRYFFESLKLVERGWGIRVNTVPIPWAIPYMVVPFSFAALALVSIELLARDAWSILARRDDLDLPHVVKEPE